MAFNVNYLGGTLNGLIPLNRDSWLKANGKFADRYINGKPIYDSFLRYNTRMFTQNLFEAYWTVRSFKVDFRALFIEVGDPFTDFLLGGGSTSTLLGATAGIAAISDSIGGGSIQTKGYTKMYHRNYKTVTKERTGKKSLEADEKADPNPLESFIFKPNEGTLASPGPVHIFKQQGVSVKIDFSDIIYRGYFYYPRINITASTSRFSFSTAPNFGGAGGWGTSIQNVIFMGSLIPVTVVPAKIKPTAFPLVLFNCEIKPGDRCCDRFYWDGKDKEREKDCDSCNDKDNKDIEKDGVYAKQETVIKK